MPWSEGQEIVRLPKECPDQARWTQASIQDCQSNAHDLRVAIGSVTCLEHAYQIELVEHEADHGK